MPLASLTRDLVQTLIGHGMTDEDFAQLLVLQAQASGVDARAGERRRSATGLADDCIVPLAEEMHDEDDRMSARARVAATACAGALARTRSAQAWPAKPVRIIVPFTAGSATDILARTFGQKLSEAWGQPVIVENRPGAGGTIGAGIVAQCAAGRLHAARALGRACGQPVDLSGPAVRHAQGLRRDRAARRAAERARRRAVGRLSSRSQRSDRAGEAEAGRVQLRLGRCRQRHAHQRGEVQARDRHRRGARAVQGHARGAHRHDGRPRHVLLLADLGGAAAGEGRQADRARGVERAALERAEGRADDRRIGRARASTTTCGWACSDRRRCRADIVERINKDVAARACDAGDQGAAREPRRRADADDAGRVQAVRARRDGRRREDRQGSGHQGTVTISPPGAAEARRGRRRANRGGRQAIESDLRRLCGGRSARAPVSRYIVALTEPPSMTRFWPMTKPGVGTAQERAGLAELVRRAEAPGRILGDARGEERVVVLAGLRRQLAQSVDLAVGEERAGQQVVDRDVVLRDLACEAGDEAGQACARAVRQAEMRERRLHRARRDVDDAPEPARDHAVDDGADQHDRRHHVVVDGLLPRGLVPVAEVADRRAAGVVDQDVGRRARGEHLRARPSVRRDVGGDGDHASRRSRGGSRRPSRSARRRRAR